jgi:hypothetical protein
MIRVNLKPIAGSASYGFSLEGAPDASILKDEQRLSWRSEFVPENDYFNVPARTDRLVSSLPCNVSVCVGTATPEGKAKLNNEVLRHGYISLRPLPNKEDDQDLLESNQILQDSDAPISAENLHVSLFVSEEVMSKLVGVASGGKIPECEIYFSPELGSAWAYKSSPYIFIEWCNFSVRLPISQ